MMTDFTQELAALRPELSHDCLLAMERYYLALVRENQKMNLTRITAPAHSARQHFADSLAPVRCIPQQAHVIDVGAGGGFPGVPLKIARPDISLTLVDSSRKKCAALQAMCQSAEVDATVLCARAETLAAFREGFDIAVCRAVAALPVVCELCLPLLRTGGLLLAYKTGEALKSEDASHALSVLGGSLRKSVAAEGDKVVLVIEKTTCTPPRYPRRYAQICRQPL